jgi:hypothetical protein
MSGTKTYGVSGGRRRASRAAALEKLAADSATEPTAESATVAPTDREEDTEAALASALERLAADLRGLTALARSAALPPAHRVDEAERTALQHLGELRMRLGLPAPEDPAAASLDAAPLPSGEPELDSAWREPEHAQSNVESSQA